MRGAVDLDSQSLHQAAHVGFDGIDRIKRGMMMPREFDIAVQGDAVNELE